jgi:predicted TIM-barrel fold metal-dependent hydrolase
MTGPIHGAIDCDVHVVVPGTTALLPYLEPYWAEQVRTRGVDDLTLTSTMPHSPFATRSDWRPSQGKAASKIELLREHLLDPFDLSIAICNCVWGAQAIHSEDFAVALCRAVNTWIAKEWLDKDSRLRASIVIPTQSPSRAAEEIEHWAHDSRFVQVLVLAGSDVPLGRRQMWPIYRAAEKHELPLCVHAGNSYRHAPTILGWPSYFYEEYVGYAGLMQSQLLSLLVEGVFTECPNLRVVLAESGIGWLPAFLWRAEKGWRGLRAEVPWVSRSPIEIIRESVRLTAQPFDGPTNSEDLARLLDQIGSDEMLLFSTDYPHWQFEGNTVLPDIFPDALARKIAIDNPKQTYRRLGRMQ